MIVVIDQTRSPAGIAIARAAVAAGGVVELVARIPDDPSGDRLLLTLSDAGVGHVASLRQPIGHEAADLEAADIELALRYLSDASTIVVAPSTDAPTLTVATDAAGWAGGNLIVVLPAGGTLAGPVPDRAIVLEAPTSDPDGVFGAFVGTLAARIDGGMDAAAAFASAVADGAAWTPVLEGDDP